MRQLHRPILAAGAAITAVTALLLGAASTASARPAPTSAGELHASLHTASWGLILNIKNGSTHTMKWLEDQSKEPNNAPKPLLKPGETDRLVYKGDSSGMSIRPTYLVGDTKYTVFPAFSVPPVGPNLAVCTADDRAANSPVASRCDIGKGWEPDAHLTFVNR